jgi:PhnB protein
VRGAAAAIAGYEKAFHARRHAEIRIGESALMLTDESPDSSCWKGPLSRGGTPLHLSLYVADADAVFARAVDAGASVLLPMKDQPYGERSGAVTDPFGRVWDLSTPTHRKEAV